MLVSPNDVWKTLRRHGLSTRAKRPALVAGYRAPSEPPREPDPEPHITSTRPGELVGIDCSCVGRLHGTAGTVWQITAIDTDSGYACADLVSAGNEGAGARTPANSRAESPLNSKPRAGSSSTRSSIGMTGAGRYGPHSGWCSCPR